MLFRKNQKAPVSRPTSAFDDPTSIGNVLLRLGKLTTEQLYKAVGQKSQFDDALLGSLLQQMGFVKDVDVALAMKIQAEMRAGSALNAELDVLQSKMDESASGARELALCISDARSRRRDRGEKSGVFLAYPPLARSSG